MHLYACVRVFYVFHIPLLFFATMTIMYIQNSQMQRQAEEASNYTRRMGEGTKRDVIVL